MSNNNNPAIVIIAFNRPNSLKRLLASLENLHYSSTAIALVISIDFQDSENHNEVVLKAAEFDWKHGKKQVITHTNNLGLRKHILACGELTKIYSSIIMLEDDLTVSPGFYDYAQQALDFYKEDSRIGGISLYNHKRNFLNGLPFELMGEYRSDIYFLQMASSWGQAWNLAQWQRFSAWYQNKPTLTMEDKLPDDIVNWPETSWLKYFTKFINETDSYFVYPKISFTSNYGDRGIHNLEKDTTYQVPLCIINPGKLEFINLEDSINVYDCFFELKSSILSKLTNNQLPQDLIVDLNGMKNLNLYKQQFAVSSKKINSKKILASYGLSSKPMPVNILCKVDGSDFHLAEKTEFINYYAANETEYKLWIYAWGKIKAKILIRRIQEKLERKLLQKVGL